MVESFLFGFLRTDVGTYEICQVWSMGKCRWCWSILGYGDFTTQHLKKKMSLFFWGGADRQSGWSLLICGVFFLGLDVYIYIYVLNTYTHILYIFAWKPFVVHFVAKKTLQKKGDLNLKDKTEAQNKTNFGGKSSTQVRICDEFPRSFSL